MAGGATPCEIMEKVWNRIVRDPIRPDYIVFDECSRSRNEWWGKNMEYKTYSGYDVLRVPPKVPKGYTTVGVRFFSSSESRKVYTYFISRKVKLRMGQELLVDAPWGGPTVVFVVRIDRRKPEPLQAGITYKTVRALIVDIPEPK